MNLIREMFLLFLDRVQDDDTFGYEILPFICIYSMQSEECNYCVVLKHKCLLYVVNAFCSVEDLGSLFEKRDFKEKRRTTGTKSTLSMRLEQCPQQLNNPFNEYSKFDGKVNFFTFCLFYLLFVCLFLFLISSLIDKLK